MKFNFIMNLHTFIQQKKENDLHLLISSSIKVKVARVVNIKLFFLWTDFIMIWKY